MFKNFTYPLEYTKLTAALAPESPGVFRILVPKENDSMVIVYVGSTTNLRQRLTGLFGSHYNLLLQNLLREQQSFYDYLILADPRSRQEMAEELIFEVRPECNLAEVR